MALALIAAIPLLAPWFWFAARIFRVLGGREFFASVGAASARLETEAVRHMALTYAGLVFAGLAIGLDATDRGSPSNSAPLVVALISAVLAWAVSNLGSRRWVAFVADALLLLSVGELLIGVLALFSPSPDAFVTGVVAIGWIALVGLSFATAHTTWVANRQAARINDGAADVQEAPPNVERGPDD